MARTTNKLNPQKVAKLVKGKVRGRYGDGLGLELQISKYGSAAWVFRYRLDRQGSRYLGLGPVHSVNLAEARNRARQARQLLLDGKDPITVRREAVVARRSDAYGQILLKDAVERFATLYKGEWTNAKYQRQWKIEIGQFVPSLATWPCALIDAAAINHALAPSFARAPETSKRVKSRVERVLQWVKDGMPMPMTRPSNGGDRHHAAVPYAEIPSLVAALRNKRGATYLAIQFTILTACRSAEALGARHDEIADGIWTIPSDRAKTRKPFRVPLSREALEIVSAIPANQKFLFEGMTPGKPLAGTVMLPALKSVRPGVTVHGLRSSFRDWAAERTNYPREIAELCLAHTVKTTVERAYWRGDALERRRALMAEWAVYCTTPSTEATVTPIRRLKNV